MLMNQSLNGNSDTLRVANETTRVSELNNVFEKRTHVTRHSKNETSYFAGIVLVLAQ